MSFYKELNYTSKIREITGVQFSILSPEEIEKRSVVHVTQTLLYDASGEPIVGGLMDPRMGVIDHGKICPTDGLDNKFCPGYFGHINLSKPVFHIQYLPVVLKVLKCVCVRCSKLLIDVNHPNHYEILKNLKGKKRWTYILEKCSKIKVCGENNHEGGCGAIQPNKYVKEGLSKIYAEWKEKEQPLADDEKRQLLTAEIVLKLFKRITETDCEALGLSTKWCKPSWLICTVLSVPPPSVRPSVKQYNNQRSEDDITHKLIDILKTNNHLRKKMDNEKSYENTVEEWTQVLQYHVATLIDNEIPGVNASTHRSGRALKTIRQRLKGKEGRIRGNLMGKRVDFSARSVITPDPNISIDELGVPEKIAMNLTFPEIVNKYNKDIVTQYVRNGPTKHPGAKSLKRKVDGKITSLLHIDTSQITLEIGDVVDRHLIDGDVVLFNRQPSLHKMSMQAHKVRVVPYLTFRLNVTVTKPYNADFDGDEMNMHVPQSLQTRQELLNLAAVPLQIISPRVHTPIIQPVQDTMLGIYRLTNDGVYLNRFQLMNILIYIKSFDGVIPEPEIKDPIEKWSGRQLVSIILPKNINLERKNGAYDNNPIDLNKVIITDGKLIQGRIDKPVLNAGTKGLLHVIYNDYGPEVAHEFLDNLQFIVTRYLVLSGFSVGISDLIADGDTMRKMDEAIIKKKKDVSSVIQKVHQKIFDNESNQNNNQEFETKVNNILNSGVSDVGKIGIKSLNSDNRMTNMVRSGSKGSNINISQMIACVGQQNVDGKRIPNGFGDRTLPHYQKYDESPESRGFVENSFIRGLNPEEFFFHAMGGREGLIDTAVKTSETGYIQRKLIKAMEDLKAVHDLSVRNAGGNIIQFLYGEDGIDYCKIETQSLEYFDIKYEELQDRHLFDKSQSWESILTKSSSKDFKSIPKWREKIDKYFDTLVEDMHMIRGYVFANSVDNSICYPINLYRLINNAKTMFNLRTISVSDIHPIYIINRLETLFEEIGESGTMIFKILLRNYLSPKRVIMKDKLNRTAFEYILETIKMKFSSIKIQCSEMVGAIAAQSIGEPATQMTLNTFHFAGVASKSNVTRGVPRLKEILHISKSIKGPSLTVYLNEEICYERNQCIDILNNIEYTSLKEITTSTKIFYDPNDFDTNIVEDKQLLDIYNKFNHLDDVMKDEDCSSSDWIIRFELDKQMMLDKNITMEQIFFKLHLIHGNTISCVYSDDNSSNLVFRIRVNSLKKGDSKINDLNMLKGFEKQLREKTIIKGIEGINNVVMRKEPTYILENNSYIKKEQWVLDTDGINLLEIMNHNSVNFKRCYSNDIYEMYEMLGIEAARSALLNEIKEVIRFGSSYVNYRHLNLLVDIMTNRGYLMSIDRFGINRGNVGPLAKCSFEETTDQLFKAAIFGEKDKLTGVSSNIMMGQIPPCGTGETDIILDESKLLQDESDDEELDDIDNWEDQMDDDYCENIGINFNYDAIPEENISDLPEIGI
jgi:DNA-directed RNA polymerase II subunit RPB1